MDHLRFIFSLLLIVSVTTTTLGSAIKANNPNGEELEGLQSDHDFSLYPEKAPKQEELEALLPEAALVEYPEMTPNLQEDEALLERSQYSNARMNTRDEDSVKQKRLDPATIIAGVSLGISVLKDLLAAIGNIDRKIAIGIDNESGYKWERPSHYFHSGTSDKNLPYSLDHGYAVLYPARKTSGPVARGVVGVVAFYVEPIKSSVAVMFSVPYDYNLYQNWWNVKLYNGDRRADYAIYEDLYYYANPFKANGWHERDLGHNLKFRGVMSSSGQPTLEIHVLKK